VAQDPHSLAKISPQAARAFVSENSGIAPDELAVARMAVAAREPLRKFRSEVTNLCTLLFSLRMGGALSVKKLAKLGSPLGQRLLEHMGFDRGQIWQVLSAPVKTLESALVGMGSGFALTEAEAAASY
jgi:hypothetical protein